MLYLHCLSTTNSTLQADNDDEIGCCIARRVPAARDGLLRSVSGVIRT